LLWLYINSEAQDVGIVALDDSVRVSQGMHMLYPPNLVILLMTNELNLRVAPSPVGSAEAPLSDEVKLKELKRQYDRMLEDFEHQFTGKYMIFLH